MRNTKEKLDQKAKDIKPPVNKGGRPKGSRNVRKNAFEACLKRRLGRGFDVAIEMAELYKELRDAASPENWPQRWDAVIDMAQYVYPKLKTVEFKAAEDSGPLVVQLVSFSDVGGQVEAAPLEEIKLDLDEQ